MFLVQYFKKSFNLPKILEIRGEKLWKVLIYFIILTFIANFPLSYLVIENQGSQMNFVETNLSRNTPNWTNLPGGRMNSLEGFVSYSNDVSIYYNADYVYIFNVDDEEIDLSNYTNYNIIIFTKSYIKFYDKSGFNWTSHGYEGFKSEINLNELNGSSMNRVALFKQFGHQIEKSFGPQLILYSLLTNQGISILSSILFVLLMAGLIQIYRIRYKNFFSYKDGMNFVMLAATIPSILSLIAGLILPGFQPVVYNLALGMIVVFVLLIYSRKVFY